MSVKSDEELRAEVSELSKKVEDLQEESDRLRGLPDAVAELKGTIATLQQLVLGRFDQVQAGVDKSSSIKTAIQFAAVLVVPILIAIIGGYFALKAGSPR